MTASAVRLSLSVSVCDQYTNRSVIDIVLCLGSRLFLIDQNSCGPQSIPLVIPATSRGCVPTITFHRNPSSTCLLRWKLPISYLMIPLDLLVLSQPQRLHPKRHSGCISTLHVIRSCPITCPSTIIAMLPLLSVRGTATILQQATVSPLLVLRRRTSHSSCCSMVPPIIEQDCQ